MRELDTKPEKPKISRYSMFYIEPEEERLSGSDCLSMIKTKMGESVSKAIKTIKMDCYPFVVFHFLKDNELEQLKLALFSGQNKIGYGIEKNCVVILDKVALKKALEAPHSTEQTASAEPKGLSHLQANC